MKNEQERYASLFVRLILYLVLVLDITHNNMPEDGKEESCMTLTKFNLPGRDTDRQTDRRTSLDTKYNTLRDIFLASLNTLICWRRTIQFT